MICLVSLKISTDVRYNLQEIKTENVVFKYLIQYSNRKAGLKTSFDFTLENKLVAE